MRLKIRTLKHHLLLASFALVLTGCGGGEPAEEPAAGEEPAATEESAVIPASKVAALADNMAICKVPDPANPSSAFDRVDSEADADGDYWVRYSCKQACTDWRQCLVDSYSSQGEALFHGRDGSAPKSALAFVVDGMGGHISLTTDQAGEQTVVMHTGGGGTSYNAGLAAELERASNAGTVMVRWDDGFIMPNNPMPFKVGWGWYSRTSEPDARVPDLNVRVASAIAWVHENLAGPAEMGTVGCSMGAQATFGAVYWHGLDDIVDYQMFGGGPPLWDINAGCGRRSYETGHCDVDASRACSTDADCGDLDPNSRCRMPAPIPFDFLYESVVNHVHATQSCKIADATADTALYAPFDESSIGFTEGDWNFEHPVDFVVDIWGEVDMQAGKGGGDINWSLGHFMRVFNDMSDASSDEILWHAFENQHHCDSFDNAQVVDIVVERMQLR